MTSTAEIQAALKAAGFDPGPIDGVRGRRTIRAVMAFQGAHGLQQDGIVGPRTAAALFGRNGSIEALAVDRYPWYEEAKRLLGTAELPGPANNQTILDWARALGRYDYRDDETPWCGLFVAHCIGSQLPDEPLPTNVLSARAWSSFGRKVTPREGCVLVFWRGSPSSYQGHVGFYAGEDDAAFHVLGGNQGDRVSIARVARSRLIGSYWPATFADTATGRVQVKASGALSTNEA